MTFFFLGIITGMIVLTTCLTLVYIMLHSNLTKVKQVVNKIQTLGKKKAILIEEENPELKSWLDNLPSG